MPFLPQTAALVLIDVQQGFDQPIWGRRNNPNAELRMAELLREWRRTQRPIVHVQHMSQSPESPLRPDQPGNLIKAVVRPERDEPVVRKQVNSAFIGTDLEQHLRSAGIDTLVIVGLTTDHCVSTTTRMAGNLGFTALVVSDATATFDRTGPDGARYRAEDIHAVSLASLHEEFATVLDSAAVLDRLR